MADVLITAEALEQAEELPLTIQRRVLQILIRLGKWPDISGARSLSGPLAGKYRLRTGDYRIQFSVEGDTVVVEKVGHRDGFYDD